MAWGYYGFAPYVSVAQRRAKAAREMDKLAKSGRTITPVVIEGRAIARTFWAKSWCEHLESFSDFSNRLERGRTYVRNGSVVHLDIGPGVVKAKVSGSSIYDVKIEIAPLKAQTWEKIRGDCRGKIGSIVELLQGKLAGGVMQIVTDRKSGLFPLPADIKMHCSCPDYATMCKHVAAVMYGIGARLDSEPELLFKLRQVDHLQLIEHVDMSGLGVGESSEASIDDADLAEIFGVELELGEVPEAAASKAKAGKSKRGSATKAKSVVSKSAKPKAKKSPSKATAQ